MRLTPVKARQWNLLVLLVLGLAVAVFAWGLRSKLSLYQHAGGHQVAHRVITAKLLTNRERPANIVVQIERATTPEITILGAVLLLATLLAFDAKLQSRWQLLRGDDPPHSRTHRVLRQIESRPPPIRIY